MAEMHGLRTRHFDRMAHLDHIEPVRIERVGGDIARRPGAVPCAASEPAGRGTGEKRREHRRCRKARPSPSGARQPVEIETRRNRLARDRAIARADRVGLRAPRGDARRILGVAAKPLLDRAAAVRREFAVDIGVQLFLGHLWFTIDHRSPHFTRRSAGRSPSR